MKSRTRQSIGLHQTVQRVLLIGAHLPSAPAPRTPQPPPRLRPFIEAIAPAYRRFDERAVHFGHRYRSGFWSIYLLSALAVLCAVLPLALGWDARQNTLHSSAGRLWTVAEVCVIATVSAIYWLGHRRDWQGQWLRARTTAELTWYLPMLAPLVDLARRPSDGNWYMRLFDPGEQPGGVDDVAALCVRVEPLARRALAGAWSDAGFVAGYVRWTIDILAEQKHYHLNVAIRQRALLRRVHGLNSWLFGLTAVGALTHLLLHTLWLSLVTTFFPALGASLHGALAQSESYRLSAASERLAAGLQDSIERIGATLDESAPLAGVERIKESIEGALALILEEHQDWHMLVRPHHLPLA